MRGSGIGLAEARIRITTSSSPPVVGMVATRNSMRCCATNLAKFILPSCGLRFSLMSRSHMILMRAIIALR